MAQYIDKSALVSEIEELMDKYGKCQTRYDFEDGLKDGRLIGYKDALYKINSLEVKEVDLNATDKQKQKLIDKAMKVICDGCAQKAECEFKNWETCGTKDELIKAMEE